MTETGVASSSQAPVEAPSAPSPPPATVEGARGRRRRSAMRAPVVVDPADVPEDAAGRVEIIVIRAPEDRDGVPEAAVSATTSRSAPRRAGWLAVTALMVLLIGLFAIGMWATR